MPKADLHLHKYVLSKNEIKAIDRVMMAVSIINPLTALPQLYVIFSTHETAGVSLVSWAGFAVFAAVFLAYGIVHKLKPLIIGNAMWLAFEVAIVAGIIMY